ncbi:anthranilate synthase family protein [uncultured Pantoea sp.]|uniref:anthranilate synthase family protein n=1 Tax=uncultured Pantoea sp. TaxID=218084 RepID=UPI002587BE5E|nr:anthranilate synthase family protein [uncultured Pantoea sp.]
MKTTTKRHEINDDLMSILSANPPPFAIIYRPENNPDMLDIFTGNRVLCETLDDIPLGGDETRMSNGHDVLVMIPFQQIKERHFDCVNDQTPLVAIKIQKHTSHTKTHLLNSIQDASVRLNNECFDSSDETYKWTVEKIIADEIGQGAGANFVLKREFAADIEDYSLAKALSIFKNLMKLESGAYWTFIVYTGEQTLIGATPERHITLSEHVVTMNPVSGTYRYPISGPSVDGILDFLDDKKEIEELYMVVDEELKMVSNLCRTGPTLFGPYIKEMANLAHSEYIIKGKTSLSPRTILKETLFAPTVTGSPLQNACRVIKKYEPLGRGYYSGVIALITQRPNQATELDSAIIIRTAHINQQGRLSLSVGSTLVRHSEPEAECLETKAKAASLLNAIHKAGPIVRNRPGIRKTRFNNNILVIKALKKRNQSVSRFWLQERYRPDVNVNRELAGLKTLILDAEDTFTSMLSQILTSLGLSVTLKRFDEPFNTHDYDLCVLGPGPGDPNDGADRRISMLKKTIVELLKYQEKFIAICLSHQVLCTHLGLSVTLKERPNQGTQKQIDLFGHSERVGFYNSYSGRSKEKNILIKDIGRIEISRDDQTHEIHALRGENFSSMQFHPESILTQRGLEILSMRIMEIINRENYSLMDNANSTH